MKRQIIAFTLAEILITIGIIGTIAAIMIPGLINKVEDIQLRSAYKKVFSDLSNASKMLINDSGSGDLYYALGINGCPHMVLDNLKPYLKVEKLCDNSAIPSPGNCWHNDQHWSNYNGTKISFSDLSCGGFSCTIGSNMGKSMILTNGTLIQMYEPCCGGASSVPTTGYL